MTVLDIGLEKMLSKIIGLFFGGRRSPPLFRQQLCPTGASSLDLASDLPGFEASFESFSPEASFNGAPGIIGAGQNQAMPDAAEFGFISREPIFSHRANQVIGHELKLRNSSELMANGASPILRLMHDELLLRSVFAENVAHRIGDELVFIRLSPSALDNDLLLELPTRNVVLAVCPELGSADKLLSRCRELKTRGFRFSLDDFTYSPGLYPLLGLVDYVRFDIGRDSILSMAEHLAQIPRLEEKILIAKCVHTHEILKIASRLSFRHYQGNHFARNTPEKGLVIPRQRAKIIMFMNLVKNHASTNEIEEAMNRDGSLVYRMLRYINSPANGVPQEIHSIAEVLSKLGHSGLYRWLGLLMFCQENTCSGSCQTLHESALLRGRLTELFGQRCLPSEEKSGLFVVGIFSLLGQLLKMPLATALAHLSLNAHIEQALLHQDGPYANFIQLAIACENHDQADIEKYASTCEISLEQVNTLYVKALVWAHELEN